MRIVYLWRLCFTVGANRLALMFRRETATKGMQKAALSARRPNQHALGVEREDPDWSVLVDCRGLAVCPVCGVRPRSRHSSYLLSLQDLAAQGTPVTIRARLTRWRCQNGHCERRIFAERLPELATPCARRTARMAGIVQLFGHSAAGRPSERLTARHGMPFGHTTILRSTAATLCVKPRGQMTPRQIVNVDALKAASGDFTTMRKPAMRFRGLFRRGSVAALDIWLTDAQQCGIYAIQRFAVTIRQDIVRSETPCWNLGTVDKPRAKSID
jgi:transposase